MTATKRVRANCSTELIGNIADAVTYLSRVADDAGMEAISADLLSIRERLSREAQVEKVDRGSRKKPVSRSSN